MGIIVPAIIPTSLRDLEEKLARLKGVATDIQIDIIDGVYAAPASWPYVSGGGSLAPDGQLPFLSDFRFEMDLMVKNPEEVTGAWIAAGATRIVAHLESTAYLPRLITDMKEKYGHEKGFAANLLSFGIAIQVDTNMELLEPYLPEVDFVQFMGIKRIGVQGQPFATEVLNHIAVCRAKHPDIPVQVDGGVHIAVAPRVLAAGVSRLIVGSDIWNATSAKDEYERLNELTEEHGLYA